MENFLTQNGDRFSAEFFSSTRRLPAAARRRAVAHRGRADRQEQRRNRKKEPAKKEDACANCRFLQIVEGGPKRIFFCKQKTGRERRNWYVGPFASCENFESPQVSPSRIEQIEKTGAKLIPLSQGKFAIVDPEDYERLKKHKWCAAKGRKTYYAVRSDGQKQTRMHRLITHAPKGLFVDHENHNGLDNRKQNLRLCTRVENNLNRRPRRGTSSRYKGVSRHKRTNRYIATISYQKKRFYLGSFRNEVDAAKAYDKKAKELFGKFAYLNFPNDFPVIARMIVCA